MPAYPVIGVGDVHGGDAQEVNERGIIAASAQSPHTMGRNMVRLQGAGPAHQPGVPIPVPGSPGDQAVHGAATVVISDPIVIDAETAGARCGCSLEVFPTGGHCGAWLGGPGLEGHHCLLLGHAPVYSLKE